MDVKKTNELFGRDIKMIKCWKWGAAFTTTQILAGTEPQGLASETNVNMEGIQSGEENRSCENRVGQCWSESGWVNRQTAL